MITTEPDPITQNLRVLIEFIKVGQHGIFQNSLLDHTSPVFLFRYFDDLRSLGVFNSADETSKQPVLDQLTTLQHNTYHPSIQLVVEKCDNKHIPFLEGSAMICNDSLSLSWSSKNFLPLLTTGKLKYFTSQDFFSFAGKSTKSIRLATAIGKLSTVVYYSLSYRDLVLGFSQLMLELLSKKYPWKFCHKACMKMFKKANDCEWSELREMAHAVYNFKNSLH
jgi:hypothetical protein